MHMRFLQQMEQKYKRELLKNKTNWHSRRKVTPLPGRFIQLAIIQQKQKQYDERIKLVQQMAKYSEHLHQGIKTQISQSIKQVMLSHQFFYNQYFLPDFISFDSGSMHHIYNYMITQSLCLQPPAFTNNQQQPTDNKNRKISLKYFKKIQNALPKPRKMSKCFIQEMRNKLYQYRVNIRNKSKPLTYWEAKNKFNLSVGEKVWVFCPICSLIHAGTVLSHYKDSFLINFDEPLLGALKVAQNLVSAQLQTNRNKLIPNISFKKNQSIKKKQQKIDMEALSIYLYLLQMKRQLISKMRQYNFLAEKNKRQSLSLYALSQSQIQQYGWIGSVINIITIVTRYLHNNYAIKSEDDKIQGRQKCMKNSRLPMLALSEVYLNFNTNQYQRPKQATVEKIKQESQQQQQQVEKDQDGEKVQNCAELSVGILKNLEKKGRHYRIEQDDNYMRLEEKYKKNYREQIEQVHIKLHNIIKKLCQ